MNRIQTMSPTECWQRLSVGAVGRVVFSERALPAIRPVNYVLVGTHVLLRLRSDGLARRLDGQVVAFEIDDIDHAGEQGWSVVVTGTARVPRTASELARLDAVPLASWAGRDHNTPVWITPGDVQGRRIRAAGAHTAAAS